MKPYEIVKDLSQYDNYNNFTLAVRAAMGLLSNETDECFICLRQPKTLKTMMSEMRTAAELFYSGVVSIKFENNPPQDEFDKHLRTLVKTKQLQNKQVYAVCIQSGMMSVIIEW